MAPGTGRERSLAHVKVQVTLVSTKLNGARQECGIGVNAASRP